ncbi:hypothetical protein [Paenibacillus sp.]|uniref:hypothetical protein n=1 Tax=Paenibacillus sp. TaxID=58172 RepID=UPI002810F24B|nr:hypothetical protein [Paenibacillus sp.]
MCEGFGSAIGGGDENGVKFALLKRIRSDCRDAGASRVYRADAVNGTDAIYRADSIY